MSRRTPGLERRPREFWPTPAKAVAPLARYLPQRPTAYAEPLAGDGALVRGLAEHWPWGTCALASDIHPEALWIEEHDALELASVPAEIIITNPPWPTLGSRGQPVLRLVEHLSTLAPTWMLLDHAFCAAEYFGQVSQLCRAILPIGRVSWMGNGGSGYNDSSWYLFDRFSAGGPELIARGA